MDLQRHTRVHLYVQSITSSPAIQSKHTLEKHASEVFTRSVFQKIQAEITSASHTCGIQQMGGNESGKTYTIYDAERGSKTFQVNFTESTVRIDCSCKLLESRGYICRHLFCVMFFMRIPTIPDYMVNPRWHKEASRSQNPYLYESDVGSYGKTTDQIMISSAIWTHVNLGIRSIGNEVGILQRFHDHILKFVQENAPDGAASYCKSRTDYFHSVLDMPQPNEVFINNPSVAKNKGSGKRVRGPREVAMRKLKKPQRLCRYCNEMGSHDKRTCPRKLLDESRTQEPTIHPLWEEGTSHS